MAVKPTIPSGTRDFSPEEVYKRQYIFNTIKSVFEKYGYQPIETPTMENLSTLEGKYGEEGDRLLFRVLDSGDYLSKVQSEINWEKAIQAATGKNADELRSGIEFDWESLGDLTWQDIGLTSKSLTSKVSEKGLRYDLTVPFARYVVMHQNEIAFPFKRYQIQSVFRADRPQKGRYREFFQCDADVVGSDSLLNEMELIQIYDEVFSNLEISVSIILNNRKILVGIAEVIGALDKFQNMTIALDKLDKIGIEGVKEEMLRTVGINQFQFASIEQLISLKQETTDWRLYEVENILSGSETGKQGIQELRAIVDNLKLVGKLKSKLEFDISLARGLNYYTGAIIEVKPNDAKIGSIGGGGRYDDLTGVFGLKGVSGVGISFGADRIYDVMEELKLFPESTQAGTRVLFINFDEASEKFSLPLLKQVRDAGIAAEIYPSDAKLKKQMKYADDKKISFVIFTGENERNSGVLTIKNMQTGNQESKSIAEIIQSLKNQNTDLIGQ